MFVGVGSVSLYHVKSLCCIKRRGHIIRRDVCKVDIVTGLNRIRFIQITDIRRYMRIDFHIRIYVWHNNRTDIFIVALSRVRIIRKCISPTRILLIVVYVSVFAIAVVAIHVFVCVFVVDNGSVCA